MLVDLLGRLGAALEAGQIPYMVIGGQATLLYGEPRVTRDVDVTVGMDSSGLPGLLDAVEAAGLSLLVEDPESFVSETLVLPARDEGTGLRVDFILSLTSYERQAIERARLVQVGEIKVRFATPEDVIVHKVFAGRPRDLEDVRGILAKQRDVDKSYVKGWLSTFDRDLSGKGYLERFEELLQPLEPD